MFNGLCELSYKARMDAGLDVARSPDALQISGMEEPHSVVEVTNKRVPILIVDDELKVLVGLKRRLRKEFWVTVAESAQDALWEINRGRDFSVVVSDLNMPGMNGLAFLSEVRKRLPNATLIVLTGSHEYGDAVEAINSVNVFRYLVKPCPAEALRGALKDAISLHHQQSKLADLDARLSSVEQMKADFLSTISHELRTPLHHILGTSEALRNGILNSADTTHSLDQVYDSARSLNRMINDLLQLAKLRSSGVGDQALCDTSQIFLSVVDYARDQAFARGIDVEAADKTAGRHIIANDGAVLQALVCLVSNAIKFNQDEGEIRLTAELENECVIFEVADTGVGIPHDKLDQVFTPFSQLDSGLSRPYDGLGIGLTLARELIELQGGDLSLYTNEWGGVTATITLSAIVADDDAPDPLLQDLA